MLPAQGREQNPTQSSNNHRKGLTKRRRWREWDSCSRRGHTRGWPVAVASFPAGQGRPASPRGKCWGEGWTAVRIQLEPACPVDAAPGPHCGHHSAQCTPSSQEGCVQPRQVRVDSAPAKLRLLLIPAPLQARGRECWGDVVHRPVSHLHLALSASREQTGILGHLAYAWPSPRSLHTGRHDLGGP